MTDSTIVSHFAVRQQDVIVRLKTLNSVFHDVNRGLHKHSRAQENNANGGTCTQSGMHNLVSFLTTELFHTTLYLLIAQFYAHLSFSELTHLVRTVMSI